MKLAIIKKYQVGLLAILSGLMMGLSWPVNGFAPLIFISWIPLLFVDNYIRRNNSLFSKGAIVLYSFISFFVFNIFTTWWVAYSTFVGALLAFFLNSLFMAIIFSLGHLVNKKLAHKNNNFIALIFFWISFEYLHMNWELSWSWLNLGNVFSETTDWVQWYEYTGVLGGTFWILCVNILIYNALIMFIDYNYKVRYSIKQLFLAAIIIIIPIIISFKIKSTVVENKNQINVLAIQPNVDPYKEAYSTPSEILVNNILNISREYIDSTTDLIICPESSIERGMLEDKIENYPAIDSLREFVNKNPRISFLFGASTSRILSKYEKIKPCARTFYDDSTSYYYDYNSALFLQKNKPILFYHKAKLVPGVERMPYINLLKPIEKYAIDLGGVSGTLDVSKNPVLFEVNSKCKVAPIICYESIYGEFVSNFFKNPQAGFIAIITNDAWWFDSPGYKQHFSYARLRAIENRKDIIRAANTGISGFINNKGEVVYSTKFYEKTAVKTKISLNEKQTYYSKNGDFIGRLSIFISILLLLISVSRRRINI